MTWDGTERRDSIIFNSKILKALVKIFRKELRYEGYILHLLQSAASITIVNSTFRSSLPIAPQETYSCYANSGDSLIDNLGVESMTKLDLDSYIYNSPRHDAYAGLFMLRSYSGSILFKT